MDRSSVAEYRQSPAAGSVLRNNVGPGLDCDTAIIIPSKSNLAGVFLHHCSVIRWKFTDRISHLLDGVPVCQGGYFFESPVNKEIPCQQGKSVFVVDLLQHAAAQAVHPRMGMATTRTIADTQSVG
jgi:hypothetical protein